MSRREQPLAPLNFDGLPSAALAKPRRPDVLNFDALVVPRDVSLDGKGLTVSFDENGERKISGYTAGCVF